MEFVFCFLPVITFLACLYVFDNFKLVDKYTLLFCLAWGMTAAVFSFYVNTFLVESTALSFKSFTRYLAPLTEEIMKALIIIFFISRKRIGFTVDAAIYGFAAGTGFALAENMFYLLNLGMGADMLTWILRGFGTALMHGGNTALLAVIIMSGIQRDKAMAIVVWPGLLVVYLLHSAYNHFFLHPFLQAVLLLIILPAAFALVFIKNNKLIQSWLEIEFNNEVDMLRMIRQGRFRQTRAGSYLASLRKHFSSETIVDLYCYVSLYLELSIKAKRNLMLKENGFQIFIEEDVKGKLLEIEHLRKRIGKTGELALQPLVRMKHRELWKLNQLKK